MATCRPGTAAAAALVIVATVGLALRGFARTAAPAPDPAAGGPLLGPRLRAWYRGLLEPFAATLVAAGVSPDALTWAQLGVSVLAGAAFATGCVFLAGWLTILAGTLDILDGAVARGRQAASARGAFVDSVVDRWAEFATFLGLGLFFRTSWVCLVVVLAAFASLMVSYARARAEGLGLPLTLGRAQRPERYVLLGFGAWSSGLVAHLACPLLGRPTHAVLAAAVVMLAAVSLATALERARHAARALRTEAPR
ncbi:MAG TPA: CDP-alcohol phosphatidyltransferase family protein [Candidatus Binatia bacterium]|nr:CDP-alcohol phosphatidyltransferase family protein [Candidatus Binatia bacterium]